MKMNFSELFSEYPDGSIEPKHRIRIGGIIIGPGMRFKDSVSFSGINIFLFRGRGFEIEKQGDILVIKGVYS